LIILNAAHLRRALEAYVDHYNNDRTYLALDKDAPDSHPIAIMSLGGQQGCVCT